MRVNMVVECYFFDGMKYLVVSSSILNIGWKNLYLNVYIIKFFLVVQMQKFKKKFVFFEGEICQCMKFFKGFCLDNFEGFQGNFIL